MSYPEHVVPTHACPYCLRVHDRAMGTDPTHPEPPEAGNVFVCIACAGLSLYTATGTLRFPDDAELVDLGASPAVARARAAVLDVIRQLGTP